MAKTNWFPLLPGNIGAVAIDPKAPTTIYAGIDQGAMKSIDGGRTWGMVDLGRSPLQVSALAIDPQSPQTVYAGTSGGMLKSTDGGASWQTANTGLGGQVSGAVIVPQSTSTIYAATPTQLFKSSDAASTWKAVRTIDEAIGTEFQWKSQSCAVFIDRVTPGTVYALFSASQANGFQLPVWAISKSVDGGATWKNLSAGDQFVMFAIMAIDSQTPAKLYLVGGLSAPNYMATSVDGGANWSPFVAAGLDNLLPQQLTIDAFSPSTLYLVTGPGASVSHDGGHQWTAFNEGLPGSGVQSLTLDPVNAKSAYACTNVGLYKRELR